MRRPVREAPHRRRAAAARDDRGFQIVGPPVADGGGDGGLVAFHPKGRERRGAVMRRVGVQPDPAVARLIVSGDRVPDRGQGPSDRPERHAEPAGREPPIDPDLGRLSEQGPDQIRDREPRGSDGSGGEIADREGRGKLALAREAQARLPFR